MQPIGFTFLKGEKDLCKRVGRAHGNCFKLDLKGEKTGVGLCGREGFDCPKFDDGDDSIRCLSKNQRKDL